MQLSDVSQKKNHDIQKKYVHFNTICNFFAYLSNHKEIAEQVDNNFWQVLSVQ